MNKKGVVYIITCGKCDFCYVGRTGRYLAKSLRTTVCY